MKQRLWKKRGSDSWDRTIPVLKSPLPILCEQECANGITTRALYGIPRNALGAQWKHHCFHIEGSGGRSGTVCKTSLQSHASRNHVSLPLIGIFYGPVVGNSTFCGILLRQSINNEACHIFCSKVNHLLWFISWNHFFCVTPKCACTSWKLLV